MRFVLVGVGSLGDVVPQLSLAAELGGRGHTAVVVGLAPYAPAAAALGVEYVPVDIDTRALWPEDPVRRQLALMQPGLMYLGMLRRLRASAALVNDALMATVLPGDVVVSGLVTAGACTLLARQRHARTLPILYAPLLPADSPASSSLAPRIGGVRVALAGSRIMWRLSERLAAAHTVDMATRLRTAKVRRPLGQGPVLMATSPAVSPQSARWPAGLIQTGRIDPVLPSGTEHLPAELDDFLTANPSPVLMTFGTCPVVDAQADADLFLAAARRADRPVLLQTEALPRGPIHDRAYNAQPVPHSALLPRLAAVVHHGGAGTTYATLAAGRPAVVVPHLGDQAYYGRRVRALGAGPGVVPRWRLTDRVLARLVDAAYHGNDGVRHRRSAAVVAARLAQEKGRAAAADALLRLSVA